MNTDDVNGIICGTRSGKGNGQQNNQYYANWHRINAVNKGSNFNYNIAVSYKYLLWFYGLWKLSVIKVSDQVSRNLTLIR